MWRKGSAPQDKHDGADGDENDNAGDYDLNNDESLSLVRGSSDFDGYMRNRAGSNISGSTSPPLPFCDSPGSQGLHQRHPTQYAVEHSTMPTSLSNGLGSSLDHPVVNAMHSQPTTQPHNNRSGFGTRPGRFTRRTKSGGFAGGGVNVWWKKLAPFAFALLILLYIIFFYFAQSRYYGKNKVNVIPYNAGQTNHIDIPPVGKNAVNVDSLPSRQDGQMVEGNAWNASPGSTVNNGQEDVSPDGDIEDIDGDNSNTLHHVSAPDKPTLISDMLDYQFRAVKILPDDDQQLQQKVTIQWSTKDPLRNVVMGVTDRRNSRRLRTSPPKNVNNHHRTWYQLSHSSKDTIASLHSRWTSEEESNNEQQAAIDASKLCGSHAKEAASFHPKNYLYHHTTTSTTTKDHRPLGPQSRVMISGILSPLGLHLAIALYRQCGVVNFLGLDTMFPNDPLIRLEYQERLAVLMQELGDFGDLQVPFLGLASKQQHGTHHHDGQSQMLVELRNWHHNGTFYDDNNVDLTGQQHSYAMPYHKYGIPLTPGITKGGSGHLDAILEYRPTHIVHLAGTQSDSLLSANYHAHGDDVSSQSSHRSTIFENRDEEEDDILMESISSRPHLFDLRMGVTGMEQLLSGVVAQTMIPPKHSSEKDLAKMKAPHIVYASSYDSMFFRDTTSRLQQNARRGVLEHETLGNTSPPLPKAPSRGLHGMSRLVDEILASSYKALHNVPSIGLRFDVIYGPRGFGVPSTSVPIYHADRVKKTKRGVSPDVDLAETAVRSLYRTWTDAINAKKAREEAEKMELDKKNEGDNSISAAIVSEGVAAARRRLEQARHLNLIEDAGWMHLAHERRDFVFVDDAVGAIIAAMQYRSVDDSPTTFNIGSGEMLDLASLADEINDLVMPPNSVKKTSISKNVIDVEQSRLAHAAGLLSHDYLRWSTKTSFKDGAAKLVAWHLDRAMQFFRPVSSSDDEVDYSISQSQKAASDENILLPLDGEQILSRRGISSCSYDDPTCLRELHTSYPCSSECSTQSCTPSVFDNVLEVSHELTEDCDVVLYTMALGYDVESLGIETEYSDGEEQEKWFESTVCTVAFVPSESALVKKIITQVPPEKLLDRGVTPASSHMAKVKGLNGYLAHHGWVLILVDGAIKPLTAEDLFVPKLSPARLFHPTVRKAMFVEENFSHTPYPEDAQFLTSETSRGVLPKRTITGPDKKGGKTKYKLPEEPQRRAVLLLSPMRQIPDVAGDQMPLKEITVSFMKDAGLEPEESDEIRTHREFYERARSSINSMDLRSLNPILRHKIEIKDFIRSKWVIHHMKLEEGHQLRCEWYREHIRWGTLLDQLSFSYVMAKRELARKIISEQPLPTEHGEELTILQQILRLKSDAHEWHPIFSGEGSAQPIHHSEIALEAIPVNLQDLPENEMVPGGVSADLAYTDVGSTFYVRIMSDTQMLESRKKWIKARDNHRKYVKSMNEIEETKE